jgi:signal transduction histidine kinase
MNKPAASRWHLRSLERKIGALFFLFGLLLAAGLTIQGNLSQELIIHPIWQELLEARTEQYLADGGEEGGAHLPATGPLRGWRLGAAGQAAAPADMPPYFAALAPGFYDEQQIDRYDPVRSYAVLVTPVGGERIVMAVDITKLEDFQNMTGLLSALIALLSGIMIVGSLLWLYRSMRRPIQSLSQRMDELDPEQPAQRISTQFELSELHDIAVDVNRHLDRVERFIERERSLLDQASHEFRTPIAVVAGAVDVIRLYDLPAPVHAPLERIQSAADSLQEIMAALLYLSREPDGKAVQEATRLDTLVAMLVEDHQHLLDGKQAKFVVEQLQPQWVQCPEAIVRIVASNLLRNAAENSYQGAITIRLSYRCLSIQDSGVGFDVVAAARRYTQGLRDSAKQGGGQGLGLFLTRRVCERFGWTLRISSSPAHGTLAELHFPEYAQQRHPLD